MFDGNMFLDEQGMPILNIALKRMLFEDALPEPFSVATQMLRSLIDGVSKMQPPCDYYRLNSNIYALKDNNLADSILACIDLPCRDIRRLLSSCGEPVHRC